ncbi:MAG TPA: Flp family type IVb pilin [Vicinamibacteria bacterium]|nr:Flp family type IVb pilin [Vicinamibacteria bacterium]HXV60411.1 Flp family type IVb pilin [Vicinamibacteria bacterium]
MKQQIIRFFREEDGPTAVEYALMLVMVALAIALALPNISQAVINIFTAMANALVVP